MSHGTNTGYVLHYKAKEIPCAACQHAHKVYQKRYAAARHAALLRLVAAHREEYQTSLAEALAGSEVSA